MFAHTDAARQTNTPIAIGQKKRERPFAPTRLETARAPIRAAPPPSIAKMREATCDRLEREPTKSSGDGIANAGGVPRSRMAATLANNDPFFRKTVRDATLYIAWFLAALPGPVHKKDQSKFGRRALAGVM